MKGAIYTVIFSHMKITHVIFTCEDIQFSRKSLPGISLVFILEELFSISPGYYSHPIKDNGCVKFQGGGGINKAHFGQCENNK